MLGALEGEQAAGLAPGVELVLEASRGSATPPPVAAASDGNFTIAGVPPGQYRLRTAAQPPGWFLASAVVRGVNALTSDFSVEAGEEILDIAVTLTDRPAGVTGSVYDARAGVYVPRYGRLNSERDPLFHQLDVRVEKVWRPGPFLIAAYLDVQNVYNQQNREGVRYSYDYRESEEITGLPFFPNLGLRGEL